MSIVKLSGAPFLSSPSFMMASTLALLKKDSDFVINVLKTTLKRTIRKVGAKQKLKVLINVFQILVITQEVNFDGG